MHIIHMAVSGVYNISFIFFLFSFFRCDYSELELLLGCIEQSLREEISWLSFLSFFRRCDSELVP